MCPAVAPAAKRDHAATGGPGAACAHAKSTHEGCQDMLPRRLCPPQTKGNRSCPQPRAERTNRSPAPDQEGMRILVAALALLLSWSSAPPVSAGDLVLDPPVKGRVMRGFDAVARYAAGHRGVDLEADVGEQVRSAARGLVRFTGRVAGIPVVSIDHGSGWRTTYQPVAALVHEGQVVEAGDVIGTVSAGHCQLQTCLHWGLTDGTDYADPLAFLRARRLRLVPKGTRPNPPPLIGAATVARSLTGLPVAGRLSSAYGMRRHPITGVWKLHDGTDIAAPCGTPVITPSAGTVTRSYYHAAYGYRVFIEHDTGLVTSYNHLPSLIVRTGQALPEGGQVGTVGNTGLSTGCHLHWMAWRDGRLIDPLTLVRS